MGRKKLDIKDDGITLMELIIVVSLLSFVIMAATSLDMAARRFFQSGARETAIINPLSVVMEQIVKDVSFSNSIQNETSAGYENITLWQDINNTPWDTSDDRSVRYIYNKTSFVLQSSYDLAAPRDIATNIRNCLFSLADSNTKLVINLTGRYNASQDVSPDNPELSLSSNITLREKSAQ